MVFRQSEMAPMCTKLDGAQYRVYTKQAPALRQAPPVPTTSRVCCHEGKQQGDKS